MSFNKLKVRLLAAYKIIFLKYRHWAIIDLTNENLIKLLKDENFETEMFYHGIQPYIFYKMIKMISNSKDDIDMTLDKAQFEVEANLSNNKKINEE